MPYEKCFLFWCRTVRPKSGEIHWVQPQCISCNCRTGSNLTRSEFKTSDIWPLISHASAVRWAIIACYVWTLNIDIDVYMYIYGFNPPLAGVADMAITFLRVNRSGALNRWQWTNGMSSNCHDMDVTVRCALTDRCQSTERPPVRSRSWPWPSTCSSEVIGTSTKWHVTPTSESHSPDAFRRSDEFSMVTAKRAINKNVQEYDSIIHSFCYCCSPAITVTLC